MTSDLALKAKRNGRCPKFPGYCDKSAETCDKYHPVIQCERYPKCTYPQCTFLHPLCEYDCAELNCPRVSCPDFHPFRSFYREKYGRPPPDAYPDMDSDVYISYEESNASLMGPPPGFEIDRNSNFNGNQPPGYGSDYLSQPFERPAEVPLMDGSVSTSTLPASDLDYLLRREMRIVQDNITLKGIVVCYSRFFPFSSCLGCRKRAASQFMKNCRHVIFCSNCLQKNLSERGYLCALCGIWSESDRVTSLL